MLFFEKKIDSAIEQTKSMQAILEHLKEVRKAAEAAANEDLEQVFADDMTACGPALRAGKEAMSAMLQWIADDLEK